MSGQHPSQVKVPPSASNYTPGTMNAELRSSINALLLTEGHAAKIQERLLHILNANSNNWPTAVQNHAAQLLRENEVSSFPALLRRVLEDVRRDTQLGKGNDGAAANGTDKPNGDKKAVNGADQKPNLAVPTVVVEEALKVTRECLEEITFIDD